MAPLQSQTLMPPASIAILRPCAVSHLKAPPGTILRKFWMVFGPQSSQYSYRSCESKKPIVVSFALAVLHASGSRNRLRKSRDATFGEAHTSLEPRRPFEGAVGLQ